MTTFRGEPLTHDAAEAIMQGWYGEEAEGKKPYSWLAVAGQNPAYDHFPCQYQIWYRGKAKGSFWYNPVFKVQTLDGDEVWRRSDYRCKRGDVPGTFYFSFMDNGVTSLEYWRIVDAADDLSWSLYYYAGGALLHSTPLHSAPLRSTPLHSAPLRFSPLTFSLARLNIRHHRRAARFNEVYAQSHTRTWCV